MSESVSYIERRFPLLWRTAEPSEGEHPLRIFKERAMFGFRPYVPGFNVEPPAERTCPAFA